MRHPIFEALADTGREVGPRAVAVLIAMVEMAELGTDSLTIAGGCREVAAETPMSRSSGNDEMKKLIAAGRLERYSAGSTSVCVIRTATLGLVPKAAGSAPDHSVTDLPVPGEGGSPVQPA